MKNLIFLTIVLLNACVAWAETTENYKIEIGQFDKIKVTDDVNVVYRCLPDSTGLVQYRGTKEFADAFILSLKNDGTLKIQLSPEDVGKEDLPVLFVYSDFLISVENSSNSSVTIESLEPCAEFKATQIGNGSVTVEGVKANKVTAALTTGNGTINISGNCTNAVFRMVGTGLISADRLKAIDVQCKILGSGSIGCWAVDNLSVKGLGSTKIYYKGNPRIKKSGGGKIFELPESEMADKAETNVDYVDSESQQSYKELEEREKNEEVAVEEVIPEEENFLEDENEETEDDPHLEEVTGEEEDDEEDDEEYQTVVTADD